VIISNITMDLHRYDWFWAGDGNAFNFEIHRSSEWNHQPRVPGEPGPGLIKDVIIRDIIVHCQGSSHIEGHPERWLEGVTFENIKFFISHDPHAPYDQADSALVFRRARNLRLRNIEVYWDKPSYENWQSALQVEDVDGLELSGFSGIAARPEKNIPAVELNRVANANIESAVAPAGTNVFLKLGAGDHDIHLFGNDFHQAKTPLLLDPGVHPETVTSFGNAMAPQ
jgi:hypothetical protein